MRRTLVLVVAVVAIAGCSGGEAGVTVTFVDGDVHVFTDAERAEIRSIAGAAFAEVGALLPDLEPSLELTVMAGPAVIPETGELGASLEPGHVTWTVDPSRGVLEVARVRLRSTLFHELHHQVRGWVMRGGDEKSSFMDGPVAEGMATAFERDAAGAEPPWADAPADIDAWVEELLTLPVNAPYQRWMFEHPDGRRWIGYRAGTSIVDRAMERSGRSAAELVRTPTDEILDLAGVRPLKG